MGNLNKVMLAEGKPMITALIILKNSRPKSPGQGFFELMYDLKKLKRGEDEFTFWREELKRIYAEWS